MNEVGLDPGIDHMLAMKCFDEVREHGGRVSLKFVHANTDFSHDRSSFINKGRHVLTDRQTCL